MNRQYPLVLTQQPSEPIRDKNRICSMAVKRAVFAGLGKDGEKCVGVVGREPGNMGENSCAWGPELQVKDEGAEAV
jgi:hypothetical protein